MNFTPVTHPRQSSGSHLPHGGLNFESAEERRLKLVVVTEGLQQPWSIAFLPDGAMLVTERIGRLRVFSL
jgi:glucose/arabinose dehydrogenase